MNVGEITEVRLGPIIMNLRCSCGVLAMRFKCYFRPINKCCFKKLTLKMSNDLSLRI